MELKRTGMRSVYVFIFCFPLFFNLNAQLPGQLLDSAAAFPPMPRGTADLIFFTEGAPTFASGAPFNDLDFTLLDTDYMDGENSGFDVFLPVDPSEEYPGSDKVKYIRCILNTDLNEAYGSAQGDRVILGTHENSHPFFLRGEDGVDNDYAVIQHLDFEVGSIQLKGSAEDYDLIYCTPEEGCQTEGWYLFYTANDEIDLIAFIYPCWDIEPSVSGNPPNNENPICNSDSLLNLENTGQFTFAQPLETSIAIEEGIGQYGTPGKEVVGGMTVDGEGNAYLFGSTDGSSDAGTGNKLFILKVNPSGGEEWISEIPTEEGTMIKDGITDGEFLFLCGRTLGSLPGFTNQGRWDGIILKIDLETGEIVDSDQWGNEGIDGYGNIELDDAGHFYVSAQGSPEGVGGTDDVYLVAKYDKSDLSLIWRELNPPEASGFIASAEAWGGLTYVPGVSPGDGNLVAGGWYFSNTGANAFVSVYEELNEESPIRTANEIISAPGIRADWVLDNAVDSQGNIYAAGFTTGNLGSPPAGEGDAFLVKYGPGLTEPEYVQFGTEKSDLIRKLIMHQDTLYTVGYTYGDLNGENADTSKSTGDVFIQTFDLELNPLAGMQFGTPHEDRGYATMRNGKLYVGGMTEGSLAGMSHGSFDAFLVALNRTSLEFETGPILSETVKYVNHDFRLFPNPADDFVVMEPDRSSVIGRILVLDLNGKISRTFDRGERMLDLSGLSPGIYLIKAEISDRHSFQRLVKL
jgi:hypothetical protein